MNALLTTVVFKLQENCNVFTIKIMNSTLKMHSFSVEYNNKMFSKQ